MYHAINFHFFNFSAALTVAKYSSMCRKKSGPLLLLVSVVLVGEAQFLFSDLLIQYNSIFLIYKPSLSLTEFFIQYNFLSALHHGPSFTTVPGSPTPSSLILIITSESRTAQGLFPQHSSQISPLSPCLNKSRRKLRA